MHTKLKKSQFNNLITNIKWKLFRQIWAASDVQKLSRDIIRFVRHGEQMPSDIFDKDGFASIKDLLKTEPIANLFSPCKIDAETQFNGIVYAAKGKGSRHESHYEISECGEKIRATPKSEPKGKKRHHRSQREHQSRNNS